MSLASKLLSASGGGVDKLFSDDVFSCFTYTGNGATQTINNGIDLAGKGGLVWIKGRDNGNRHVLFDTARPKITDTHYELCTNNTNSQQNFSDLFTAFNGNGFTLGTNAAGNYSAQTYVSWTFRKAPKFFDIVTYTGDGVAGRQIPHALGIAPGMVTTKSTSATGDWNTFHQAATGDLALNTTAAQTASKAIVPAASATTFTVSGVANSSGVTYVAYLFAHDTSADGIIQCGAFTTDASGNATVNLGWESQYLMTKTTAIVDGWSILDSMRGWRSDSGTGSDMYLSPNTSGAESGANGPVQPTSTGFRSANASASRTYIYLAIRRSNKPPTLGTQVYNAIARTGTGAAATVTGVGFAPDLLISRPTAFATGSGIYDRLRGSTPVLQPMVTDAEFTGVSNAVTAYDMTGISVGADGLGYTNTNTRAYINHFFKRAVGVFDEVCYTGTGVNGGRPHNLQAAPELLIQKKRTGTTAMGWYVFHKDLGQTKFIQLNSATAVTDIGSNWWTTLPTSTEFPAQLDTSGDTVVTYLFASKAGISKVGSYTGNGTTQTINCGFTTGSRFVLIKRTDAAGDWKVFDSARGIISANDPHLALNTTAAEVTTDDSIDPDPTGFVINQVAATDLNVASASYIFLSFS